ncbi:MAG: amino acid adenylation domain-containing protein [Planctomycetota bacterium]|jgi:amino acid adenylation domain-containing protein
MTDEKPSLDYWKLALAGSPPALELPTTRTRTPIPSACAARSELTLDGALWSQFSELTKREGAELREALLASLLVLLHRNGGQIDLVVGVELVASAGSTVLPLRFDLSSNPSFSEVLRRTREVLAAAKEHADVSLEAILEALGHSDRTSLFSVVFATDSLTANCATVDFALLGTDALTFGYNRDLFDAGPIERMRGHFETLLSGIVADASQPIALLPYLTAAEQNQILVEWNDKGMDFPREATLHSLIEERVASSPDAIAAVFNGESLTFAELNSRANQVAHFLQKLGVGPDVMVGISVERSFEMVIGLLGLAKAGGAYMPMDPAYPAQRLVYMVEDSKVKVLLTQKHLAASLPESDATIVILDDQAQFDRMSTANPESGADCQNLAYVIYTSGSTGAPKGVLLNHQGRVNNFLDFNRRFNVGAGDAIIALASLSFDMCAYDVFGTLAAGAKIVLPNPDGMQDPSHWASLINDTNVTTWHTAPAMLKMYVDYLELNPSIAPKSLRLVLLGGDWIPVTLPDRLRALVPNAQVISMGGATECSMDSTIFEVKAVDPNWNSIPYGEPMTNQLAYVLDANLQPVPIGAPGELYLGGIGVGRGYFERPELTAERFLDNPFLPDPAERMYRTGDLARWMPDGNLELIGRIDSQVKIRGFRIELGEIESRMREHPAVKEGVVVTKADATGEKRLVAYIVQDPEWTGPDEANADLGSEQVGQWEAVYDHAYSAKAHDDVEDPTFNIVSWDSSYTNQALPEEQMRSWVDQTVERIQRSKPDRVLEIGCGMGLLLFRIAPTCSSYIGHDFSKVALDYVARHREPLDLPQVELGRKWADDFEGIDENSLDCVVLNSIILDFPDMDYLMKVIRGSAKAVKPGGTIFLGDIRGLPLIESYQSSVQLFQASDESSVDQLKARVRRLIRHEEELVIDPRFFPWLATQLAEVGIVQIELKRGSFTNELNAYRYDVTVHIGDAAKVPTAQATWLDWNTDELVADDLRTKLDGEKPELLCVRNIPNARVQRDVANVALLGSDECPQTAGELRAALDAQLEGSTSINPEDLHDLGESLGYLVEIRFAADLKSGCFDVAFLRKDSADAEHAAMLFPDQTGLDIDANLRAKDFANSPMMGKLSRRLAPELRDHLGANLPEYMVPTLFETLEAMPLSPNGKVDRKRLPEPDTSRPDMDSDYQAPATPVEEMVAAIWIEVLALDRVGTSDAFLELGGHSLLAVLIQTRLNQIFPYEISLQDIFEYPTVAKLSKRIEELGTAAGIDALEVCEIMQSIEGLSDEEVAAQISANE